MTPSSCAGRQSRTPSTLEECVRSFLDLPEGEGELEVRLGSVQNGRFVPGVSRSVFHRLDSDMQKLSFLASNGKWEESSDFHYVTSSGTRAEDRRAIRTRVFYSPDALRVHTEHVEKVTRGKIFLSPETDEAGRDGVERGEGETTARVAVSWEKPIADPPLQVIPTHVRIRQRKTFEDVRDGCVAWRYELSKTWSGSNRAFVEHAQRATEPLYEVECELVDQNRSFSSSRSLGRVCRSIRMKTKALVGGN